MGRIWRIHHAGLSREPGERLRLSPEEAHHVRQVLRLKQGDSLRLFDGQGLERRAVVIESSKDAVEVRLEQAIAASLEAPLEIVLFQGLCRHDRMEWVIQKGTELGLIAIHPLESERAERAHVKPHKLERWHRIAIEAAKQCGRSIVPRIIPAHQLPSPGASGRLALLLTCSPRAEPLGAILKGSSRSPVWLAVGPEAGFSEGEADSWAAAGWQRASLGPRILRTETAGLAAAAIILHIWGDLGSAQVDLARSGS